MRKRRDLSLGDLAARCAEIDPGRKWTENTIENIEGGRRRGGSHRRAVTVDELLTLAAALNVAPVHLLVSPDDFLSSYQVTSEISAAAIYVRHWIRGVLPLAEADPREYFSEVPRTEYEWAQTAGTGWPLPPDWEKEYRGDTEGGA